MSDVATLIPHLERRFRDRRVVFWHDPNGQYASVVDSLSLPGVTTLRVANDEYAVKYRLLQEQPDDKILVYRSGEVPAGVGNWLLDLELAYGVFTADRSSLVSQDLGLTADGIDSVVAQHEKFFNASKRVESLKAVLTPEDDDAARLRAKMSAVVLGQKEHSLLEIMRTLLVERSKGQHSKYDALVDLELADFLWLGAISIYGYESTAPSVDDFVLWMFRAALGGFKSDRPGGLQNIQLDFASFRNDRRSQVAMSTLAKQASADLNYTASIENATFRDLVSDCLLYTSPSPRD